MYLTLLIFAFVPLIVWFTLYERGKMNKAFLKSKVETTVDEALSMGLDPCSVCQPPQ